MATLSIQKVTAADVSSISVLQQKLILTDDDSNTNGFLVSAFTEQDYQQFLSQDLLFYKMDVDGEVGGVLLAFPSDCIAPDDLNNSLLKYSVATSFILIKQVFVDPRFQRLGIASKLYAYIKSIRKNTQPLLAVTVLEPINVVSCEFHKKQGFYEFLHFNPDADKDGVVRRRAAWIFLDNHYGDVHKYVRFTNNNPTDNAEVLLARASHLTDLYMHEDNLNWTKFERQLVVLFALMAILAYFFNKQITVAFVPYMIGFVVWGILINTFFIIKIRSGITYMTTYKNKIKENDKVLSFYYPQIEKIFTSKKISGKSITVRLLLIISILCLLTWLAGGILVISKCYKIINLP